MNNTIQLTPYSQELLQEQLARGSYDILFSEPIAEGERIAKFLERPLNIETMARQVDPSLHRQREK